MPGWRTCESLIIEDTERRSHSTAARYLAPWLGETYSFCFLYKACAVSLNRRKLPRVLCCTSTHWNMWSDALVKAPCVRFHRTQSVLFTASFFFFLFFPPMRLKSLMGWTARGSRGRGVGGGGRSEVGGVRWSGWLCCGNRRPEHQSGVSRWRGGRSGWKGQRVRRANKLIFVVVHSASRARTRALEPGLLQGKGAKLARCPVAHSSGARVRHRTEGNSSARELLTDSAHRLESNDDVTPRRLIMTNYWPPFLSWCYYLLHVAFITSKSNVTNEIFTCRWSQMIWDRGEDNGSKLSEKQKH